MKRIRTLLTLVALSTLFSASFAAEDIDLFLINENAGGSIPNVLIVLDNSANWNSQLGSLGTKQSVEEDALAAVLGSSELTGRIRVGFMLFSPENPRGGYVYSAVRTLTAEYQAELLGKIDNFPQANNAPYALSLHEAFRYYSGDTVRVGLPPQHDPEAINGGAYMSPITAECQKNYIIFIGNGTPDGSEDGDALAELRALGGNTSEIPLSPSNYQSNWMDEHARFMGNANLSNDEYVRQNVITHTVAVYDKDAGNQNTSPQRAARALLNSAAQQGRGKYYPVHDKDGLSAVLLSILDSIQGVNSVFASTSLPVSVNVRGTHLNQVYMGVFRPDPQRRPRWYGNLKLYQLGKDSSTGNVHLADVDGKPAQSAATGFIVHDATSFWTEGSSYWSFNPRGIPESASDKPDGAVVEKGGVAQQLRNTAPGERQVYTCTAGCTPGARLALTPFDTSNTSITAAQLGVVSAQDRDALIDWARGADNAVDEEGFPVDENADGNTGDMRASVHGDVLHSRPAVLNYNSAGDDNDIVLFYGANDGLFRAVRGGTGEGTGQELWSLVLPEFFDRLDALRQNDSSDGASGWKPYFVDGSIGVYRGTNDQYAIDTAYLYLSMRRGGRFIYALDVSDPTDPKLMWRRGNTDTAIDSRWGELGQTWSEPRIARLLGRDNPVLIFGAGYDSAAEDESGSRSMGRGIFVVDAVTGDIVWQAGPSHGIAHSIPSDVTAIDINGDRHIDRLYVGDTGGNIWRVDVDNIDPNAWPVYKVASLGGNGSNARKFLYPPDVVLGNDSRGTFYGLVIGSGDREKPFDTSTNNHVYMIKDRLEGTETQLAVDDLLNVTHQAAVPDEEEGWYIELAAGEKVVTSALTLANNITLATNQPAPVGASTCVHLGIARIYSIDFRDGSGRLDDGSGDSDGSGSGDGSGFGTEGRFHEVPGGGIPPSPVYFITPIQDAETGETTLEEGLMLGTNVEQSQSEPLNQRKRTYWFKEHE